MTTKDEFVPVKEKFRNWDSKFTGAYVPRFHDISTLQIHLKTEKKTNS